MTSGSPTLDPTDFSVIETLQSGKEIEIRAQRPQDRKDLETAIVRISDESLDRRFFVAKHHFSERETEYFLNIDFVNHVGLVAVIHEKDKQAIVGAGRYVVIEPGAAEVAFGVIDEYQGQGIGAALMRNLSSIARQAGLYKVDCRGLGQQRSHAEGIRKERPPDEYEARRPSHPRHADVRVTIHKRSARAGKSRQSFDAER